MPLILMVKYFLVYMFFLYGFVIKINQTCSVSFTGLLTKKFVNLILEAEDRTLDLNRTADVLEVNRILL